MGLFLERYSLQSRKKDVNRPITSTDMENARQTGDSGADSGSWGPGSPPRSPVPLCLHALPFSGLRGASLPSRPDATSSQGSSSCQLPSRSLGTHASPLMLSHSYICRRGGRQPCEFRPPCAVESIGWVLVSANGGEGGAHGLRLGESLLSLP